MVLNKSKFYSECQWALEVLALTSSIQVFPGTDFHITGGGFWGHCSSECNLAETEIKTETTEQPVSEDEVEQCKTVFGVDGVCKPATTCVDLDIEDEEAKVCSKPTHACCTDFLKNDNQIVEKLAANAENQEKADQPEGVSIEQVELSIGVRLFDQQVSQETVFDRFIHHFWTPGACTS